MEEAEDVEADEGREPKKSLRPAPPTKADLTDHDHCIRTTGPSAQTASGAKDTAIITGDQRTDRNRKSLGTWTIAPVTR